MQFIALSIPRQSSMQSSERALMATETKRMNFMSHLKLLAIV
jgi:hypothetical protein